MRIPTEVKEERKTLKVLAIEDNEEMVQTLSLCFQLRWPEAVFLSTSQGNKGIELVEKEAPDIVILDLGLPDRDGFDVLKEIRTFSDVPVLILSVKGDGLSQVKGLELGADDYVPKPFSPLEFLARVRAVLRRARGPVSRDGDVLPFRAGGLTVNFDTHEVFVDGEKIHLTPLEYNLLCHLVRNAGKVMSHQNLLSAVWGEGYADTGILKTYIYQLRTKLRDNVGNGSMIVNERGVGYKFANPV